MNNDDFEKYADMLYLPHHRSTNHPHMSLNDRAAQFSSFDALTGFDDEVKETARLTENKIELDEYSKSKINEKLNIIAEIIKGSSPSQANHIKTQNDNAKAPQFSFTYFVPDRLKDGGSYVTSTGIVKKIDMSERIIILHSNKGPYAGETIFIDDVIEVNFLS